MESNEIIRLVLMAPLAAIVIFWISKSLTHSEKVISKQQDTINKLIDKLK